jgi:nickel superoxide dismutase
VAVKEDTPRLQARGACDRGDYSNRTCGKFPELHALTHKIMQLGSKCRQTASRETALQLLEAVNRFAEIYWETKGVATKRDMAPSNPGYLIVHPLL